MSDQDLQSFLATFSAQNMGGSDGGDETASFKPQKSSQEALRGPRSAVDLKRLGAAAKQQPLCTPITRMASEFPKHASGRLIAVNENCKCAG